MEDVNKRRRNFFLLLNLNAVPKKSTLEKFAYFRHFQRIGINVKKFEKTPIHFKSDVFVAVAVVDAKSRYWRHAVAVTLPIVGESNKKKKEKQIDTTLAEG